MLPWSLKTNTFFTNQPFEFWHTSQKSIRSDLKVAMWASRFFSMSATISGNVSNHQQPFVPPISLGSTPPSAPRMEAARHPHNGWHDMTFDEFEIPRTQTFMAATIASWVGWGRSKILMEEIPNNHLGWCLNFVNDGKKLPTSTGAGFLNHHQYHYFFFDLLSHFKFATTAFHPPLFATPMSIPPQKSTPRTLTASYLRAWDVFWEAQIDGRRLMEGRSDEVEVSQV